MDTSSGAMQSSDDEAPVACPAMRDLTLGDVSGGVDIRRDYLARYFVCERDSGRQVRQASYICIPLLVSSCPPSDSLPDCKQRPRSSAVLRAMGAYGFAVEGGGEGGDVQEQTCPDDGRRGDERQEEIAL